MVSCAQRFTGAKIYVADALSFISVTNVCVFVCVFDSYYDIDVRRTTDHVGAVEYDRYS